MKKTLIILTALFLFSSLSFGQKTSKLALSINHELSHDWGILSPWTEYGTRNGFGIGLMLNPARKSSWYFKYSFSQAQTLGQPFEAFVLSHENPDWKVYSKNHSNMNTISLGLKRRFTSAEIVNGYFAFDLGYNLASQSEIITYVPTEQTTELDPLGQPIRYDRIEIPVKYDHSARVGLVIGTTIKLKDYLDYFIEAGMNVYSEMVNINLVKRPALMLKTQTGLVIKI